jgi:hypothetical protein
MLRLTLNQRVPGSSPGALANRTIPVRREIGRFWGISGHSLPGFGLCGHSRIFMLILGALSLHPKIPFPAAGLNAKVGPDLHSQFQVLGRRNWDLRPALQSFRIESERLKLPAPFSRRIAEPLNADAAGQATFYGCFDKIGGPLENRNLDFTDTGLVTPYLCLR